jgi:hypothetical protein
MRAWLIKLLGGIPNNDNILEAERPITDHEALMMYDYLDGKRFVSRYHAGHKKEKVVKEKKERKSFVKAGVFI